MFWHICVLIIIKLQKYSTITKIRSLTRSFNGHILHILKYNMKQITYDNLNLWELR